MRETTPRAPPDPKVVLLRERLHPFTNSGDICLSMIPGYLPFALASQMPSPARLGVHRPPLSRTRETRKRSATTLGKDPKNISLSWSPSPLPSLLRSILIEETKKAVHSKKQRTLTYGISPPRDQLAYRNLQKVDPQLCTFLGRPRRRRWPRRPRRRRPRWSEP